MIHFDTQNVTLATHFSFILPFLYFVGSNGDGDDKNNMNNPNDVRNINKSCEKDMSDIMMSVNVEKQIETKSSHSQQGSEFNTTKHTSDGESTIDVRSDHIETSNNNNSNGLNSGAIELADNVQKLEDNISETNDKNVGDRQVSLEKNFTAKDNQLIRKHAIEGIFISIYYRRSFMMFESSKLHAINYLFLPEQAQHQTVPLHVKSCESSSTQQDLSETTTRTVRNFTI